MIIIISCQKQNLQVSSFFSNDQLFSSATNNHQKTSLLLFLSSPRHRGLDPLGRPQGDLNEEEGCCGDVAHGRPQQIPMIRD